jgi:hypothetical protein
MEEYLKIRFYGQKVCSSQKRWEKDSQMKMIETPEYRSELVIIKGQILVRTIHPMPNWWRRFWYWALLGWRWRKPTPREDDIPAIGRKE